MSTTIPAALASLLTICQAALPGVTVHDGPPITVGTKDYLCVGYDPDSDVAVEFTQVFAAARGPGNHSRKEEYEVLCQLVAFSGDVKILNRRTTGFALLGPIEDALRANPSLTGALGSGGLAQMSAGSLQQAQTNKGAHIDIRFRIRCTARI